MANLVTLMEIILNVVSQLVYAKDGYENLVRLYKHIDTLNITFKVSLNIKDNTHTIITHLEL